MNDFFAFVAFLANLIFFLWFGSTLNSINRHLKRIAEHAERQTRSLAALVHALPMQHDAASTAPPPAEQNVPAGPKSNGLLILVICIIGIFIALAIWVGQRV
jgi:small-conductance mechanosensitive channel